MLLVHVSRPSLKRNGTYAEEAGVYRGVSYDDLITLEMQRKI